MKRMKIAAGVLLAVLAACKSMEDGSRSSRPLDLSVDQSLALDQVVDSASARELAKARGYLGADGCSKGLKGGEVVMFSTATDTGAGATELGQASGVLVKKDDGIYFEQKAQFRRGGTDLIAPGVRTGADRMSSWELSSYLALICKTAFHLNGGKRDPLYTKASAAIVSIKGGTAGLEIGYEDVLEVKLERNDARGKASLTVYMVKGVGPVALHYAEANAYAPQSQYATATAAFRLYINTKGGSGVGTGFSESQATQAAEKSCIAGGDRWRTGYGQPGQCIKKEHIAFIARQIESCRAEGGDWQGDWSFGNCYTAKQKAHEAKCRELGGSARDAESCWVPDREASEAECRAAGGVMAYNTPTCLKSVKP